ncbi:MAG: TrpB-like pyridoxal phosphate-dependent enzyme [Firmicutes bacterium]|nr:TrpB-like pyridoxal phosphate-dependent enzyme [Bacillota bacterium]
MKTRTVPNRTYLTEKEMPEKWFNVRSAMKVKPEPMIHPGTKQPLGFKDIQPIFCDEVIRQELDNDTPYVDIPDEVLRYYRMFRPSPLCRAYELEAALDTPAKIYYKFEGNNTSGSHKLNSAAPQAYYAKKQGLKSITTETGAGQWGTALSMACAHFGLDLTVFMVKVSSEQKPYRKAVMETYGANVIASPSATTDIGKKLLADFPGTGGSLGCAISEAIEAAVKSGGSSRYTLGSVLNHVLLHQSVIGLESKAALEKLGEYPDIVIGCAGGGSNFGGIIAPFVKDKLDGKKVKLLAVEPANCPSLTKGKFEFDFGDTGKITPMMKMYTLGSEFIPPPDHAGGLRYHGMSPIISKLYEDKLIDAIAVPEQDVFKSARLFAKTETILPAPESAHAIHAAVLEAQNCKKTGEAKTIVFCLSGTGYFDLAAYVKNA